MSKNKRHFQFQSKQKMNFIDTYVYSFSKFSYINSNGS